MKSAITMKDEFTKSASKKTGSEGDEASELRDEDYADDFEEQS